MKNILRKYNYPKGMDYFINRNISAVGNWDILYGDSLEVKIMSIKDRYPKSELLPFAYNQDNDFIACFKENEENKVFIVLDYSEHEEIKEVLESVEEFTKKALETWVLEKILNDDKLNDTFEEICNLFADIKNFSMLVEDVNFNKELVKSYSFNNKYYLKLDILKKKNFSIQEGFARLFKEELFTNEEWSREEEPKYKEDNWSKYIESFWIPEYLLSNDSLDILSANVQGYKKEIMNLNNTNDEYGNEFYIEEDEFKDAEAVVYNRRASDSVTFINTKNYYINFSIFIH